MSGEAMLYAAQYAGNGEGMVYSLGGTGLAAAMCIVLLAAIIGILLDIL